MKISEILEELNLENGSNYKMDVLRKHADNELLQRVLKMTYDRVTFTYGISLKNIDDRYNGVSGGLPTISLVMALDILEQQFVTRELTGNAAKDELHRLLLNVSVPIAKILRLIINRDLRINMGRSNINKVFKGLIVKPLYMRCGIYNEKTAKKIDFEDGAILELKADGTYREFTIENAGVSCISRSGEEYDYPTLNEDLNTYENGVYHGELTVYDEDGNLLDRATGNGIINSGDFTGYTLALDLWDHITLEEYSAVAAKEKGKDFYVDRLARLKKIVGDEGPGYHIKVIENHVVYSVGEALKIVSKWMTDGKEGGVLKDKKGLFRDGTSAHQLKLKLEIAVEVRITGFTEGREGTKRAETFGAITFETDDGKVKGQTSGFTDAQLKDFNSRREEMTGQIMCVVCNDITKGRNNDFYALSHPRFDEIRTDKNETDTLERILELKEMSMNLS